MEEIVKKKKIEKIQDSIPNIIINQRKRLMKRLEEITSLDKLRLEQEMVYFVQKIDSSEEIERLIIHIKEIKNFLKDSYEFKYDAKKRN